MKDKLSITVTAEKLHKRKVATRIIKLGILLIFMMLSIIYIALYVVNTGGYFTIDLDPNLKYEKKILMSPHSDFRDSFMRLKIAPPEYLDNISQKWLPQDITEQEGDHSKDNYIAYSFFLKNDGEVSINYYREINIEAVVKNVDEAIRVAVYLNGEKTVYAKNSKAGMPEPETTPFKSNWQVMNELRMGFSPGDIDKYTIVVWLEGDDPDCIDDIIGGEMRMIMLIREMVDVE